MLETKGRAIILQNFSVDLDKPRACQACARTKDLKVVNVKQGRWVNQLCYCQSCWNQIINYIYKEVK